MEEGAVIHVHTQTPTTATAIRGGVEGAAAAAKQMKQQKQRDKTALYP